MAIPDSIFEDCANLKYDGGYWTASYKGEPFDIFVGLDVIAYDDRVEDWANAKIVGFERNTLLVMWEDGFRFIFTDKRCAIRPKGQPVPAAPPAMQHAPPADLDMAYAEGYNRAVQDLLMALATRVGALESRVFGKEQ